MSAPDLAKEIATSLYGIEVNYNREHSFEGRFAGKTLESVQAEYVIRRVREVITEPLRDLDLDAITADLYEASGVIDNPDSTYDWAALRALRTAEKLLAAVARVRGDLS